MMINTALWIWGLIYNAWHFLIHWYYNFMITTTNNNNDRLEIIVLHRVAEVYESFMDISSAMRFLQRTGRIHNFSIVARKGPKAIFIDKIDPVTLEGELGDFQNKP